MNSPTTDALPPPADEGRSSGSRLRVLWLKTELLHPIDKGGRIRTYEMLKRLKQQHQITYMTLDDGTASEKERRDALDYCHELVCIPFSPPPRGSPGFYVELMRNVLSPLPYAIARYRSEAFSQTVVERVTAGSCDVVVTDFLVQAINTPKRLPVPRVLFQHNVEAMIWHRHSGTQSNALARQYFRSQWRRMQAFEREACNDFDLVVAVSDEDCTTMRNDYGLEAVASVPTGVDTEFFRPTGSAARIPRSLVFTGSMDWMPNDDAIRFFLAEILPLVRQRVPDVRLFVVGRNPSNELGALARRHSGVEVTGRVPDVRPYMEQATCFVVPIRIGGGTRLKIFEAMAMEKPVVSTTIGAEGLPITNGVDVLIEDDPQAFADAIVRVLLEDDFARQIGRQAGETVRTRFGWDTVAERFSALLHDVASARLLRDQLFRPAIVHATRRLSSDRSSQDHVE